jgi:hypothetical protein
MRRLGRRDLTLKEIVDEVMVRSHFAASTVRTHVSSRMCSNAPDHHAVVYDDLVRVRRGVYRLARR